MTVQSGSRFGAGASGRNSREGRGDNAVLTTQSGARFGAGSRGNQRDGDNNSRPGTSSNALPHQKSTTTRQGRSKITANYTMEGYEGESETRMARKDNQGRLN